MSAIHIAWLWLAIGATCCNGSAAPGRQPCPPPDGRPSYGYFIDRAAMAQLPADPGRLASVHLSPDVAAVCARLAICCSRSRVPVCPRAWRVEAFSRRCRTDRTTAPAYCDDRGHDGARKRARIFCSVLRLRSFRRRSGYPAHPAVCGSNPGDGPAACGTGMIATAADRAIITDGRLMTAIGRKQTSASGSVGSKRH